MARAIVYNSNAATASNTSLEIPLPAHPDESKAFIFVAIEGDQTASTGVSSPGWLTFDTQYSSDTDLTTSTFIIQGAAGVAASIESMVLSWQTAAAASAIAFVSPDAANVAPIGDATNRATYDNQGQLDWPLTSFSYNADEYGVLFGATRDIGNDERTIDVSSVTQMPVNDSVTAGADIGKVHVWAAFDNSPSGTAYDSTASATYTMLGDGIDLTPLTPTLVGVETSSLTGGSATLDVLPLPVGTQTGDMLFLAATTQALNDTEYTTAGSVASAGVWPTLYANASTGSEPGRYGFWRVATDDDVAVGSATVTFDQAGDSSIVLMSWRNIDNESPFDALPVEYVEYGPSVVTAAVPTTVDNAVELAIMHGIDHGDPSHADSPITGLDANFGGAPADVIDAATTSIDSEVRGTAGAGSARTVTATNAAANEVNFCVMHFALRPAFSMGSRQVSVGYGFGEGDDPGPALSVVPTTLEPLQEPTTFTGSVSDTEVPDSVGVTIMRRFDGLYWDDDTAMYQPSQVVNLATLTGAGTTRPWSYDAAGAFGVVGEYEIMFTADDNLAATGASIDTVFILIQRGSDNQYWNGTGWQVTEPATWPAITNTQPNPTGRWSYPVALPVGTYTVTTYAVDADTNIELASYGRPVQALEVVAVPTTFEIVGPHSTYSGGTDTFTATGFEPSGALVEARYEIFGGSQVWNGASFVTGAGPGDHWFAMARNGDVVTHSPGVAFAGDVTVRMRRQV